MKKMIWTRPSGEKETVLFIGASPRFPTPGFSGSICACIMTKDREYLICPMEELSLSVEDYNKFFAE